MMAIHDDFRSADALPVSSTNPFEAPQAAIERAVDPTKTHSAWRARLLCFVLWLVVCGISAAPSFLLAIGMTQHPLRIPAMIGGILSWTLIYTLADWNYLRKLRQKSRVFHRAMVTGFGIRVLISILLPVGCAADMFPGMISVSLVSGVFLMGNAEPYQLQSFPAVFFTTVLQGALLNVLVWMLVLLIASILLVFSRRRDAAGKLADHAA